MKYDTKMKLKRGVTLKPIYIGEKLILIEENFEENRSVIEDYVDWLEGWNDLEIDIEKTDDKIFLKTKTGTLKFIYPDFIKDKK